MPEAYPSTLKTTFEVRGGLFFRRLHRWSALTVIAARRVHTRRHFFTGSFREQEMRRALEHQGHYSDRQLRIRPAQLP